MSVLEYIRTLWPIAVVLLPFITATGFLWLQTKFPSKGDLSQAKEALSADIAATEKRLGNKIDEHEQRLNDGSKKLAELDKRCALVEDDTRSMPSRQNLQIELSTLSQRIRGVEVWTETTSKSLDTLNSYLHTLIERGLGGVK